MSWKVCRVSTAIIFSENDEKRATTKSKIDPYVKIEL